jgi:hypothetical protein
MTVKYTLSLALLGWCFGAFAQQSIVLKSPEKSDALWLYNSKGIIVGQNDSIVERTFFKANEVFIQSNIPWKKEDKYAIILGQSSGDNRVIYLTMPVISFEVKEMIINDTGEIRISVAKAVQNQNYEVFRLIVK